MEDITVIEPAKDKKERTPAQKASIAKAIERLTEMRKKKAAEKEAAAKVTQPVNTVETVQAVSTPPVIKAKRVYKRKDPVLPTILPPLPVPAAIAAPAAPVFDYSKEIADLKSMVASLCEKKQKKRKVIIDDSSDEEVIAVKKPKNVVAPTAETPAPPKVVKPTLDISLFSRR